MKETTADAEKEAEEGCGGKGGPRAMAGVESSLAQIHEVLRPDWYSEMFPAALESL